MFEGVVSQVLAGYLGRYIKGIQKEQLKIGIWNEEILLEKVELILEAFDYLQLPFTLKNGRVGKLSIRIPWKKLGWDPIIVVLEDVFVCACQREDSEWSSESVRKRELAGKMAKLNAVELAKFSKRVSDDQAGPSFISYISAKILDNIQVSIRNVHVIYIDSHIDLKQFVFGLRFSSLTVMTDSRKHVSSVSTVGKSRGSQVYKLIEISNLALYCNSLGGDQNLPLNGDAGSGQFYCDVKLDYEGFDYLVDPFDVTVSLLVNKAGKSDGAPQYAINADLNTLILSLNEIQLQQILSLWDYFTVCKLREKYGRYRPPYKSLSEKINGWQRVWWNYALESVLADVRQKLQKTSWSNFGKRINDRRKYVDLYRRKLELLQQDQLVDKDILEELDKMDKECDIEDILNYRTIAEQQLQELHLNSKSSKSGPTDPISTEEKQFNSEHSYGRARGWLNWLSLGMLGAGGTADSNSFAGVISDDIIKDIYEAAEFHPMLTANEDSSERDGFCLVSLKSSINQVVASIGSKISDRKTAEFMFVGISAECKYWDGSASIVALINSLKIINPHDENAILTCKQELFQVGLLKEALPFIGIHVKIPKLAKKSVKVVLQPFETTYDLDFFLGILHFYDLMASFQFQHNRVLQSLNELENFGTRLQAKTEYIVYSHKRLTWDVAFHNITIRFPLKDKAWEDLMMVGALAFRSRPVHANNLGLLDNDDDGNSHLSKAFQVDSTHSKSLNFQEFYDQFEIALTSFEVKLSKSSIPSSVSVVESLDATVVVSMCIFLDEPTFKQLEADLFLPSFVMHFSKERFDALAEVFVKSSNGKSDQVAYSTNNDKPEPFRFSFSIKLDHVNFHVNFEDDGENIPNASFLLGGMNIRYSLQEYTDVWVLVKLLKADALNLKGESDSNILCSSTNCSDREVQVEHIGVSQPGSTYSESSFHEGCFELHYQAAQDGTGVHHEYSICMNDIELHIYPRFIGLLQKFCDRLFEHGIPSSPTSLNNSHEPSQGYDNKTVYTKYSNFGFSNYSFSESSISVGIPVDYFPFLTTYHSCLVSSIGDLLNPYAPGSKSLYANDGQFVKSARKWSRPKNHSARKFQNCTALVDPSMTTANSYPLILDVKIDGLRVHFHDSSCILGTVMVPKSMASFTVQGADCWDMLSSIDGLVLSSSWSPPNIHEPLWGPISSVISPVLNVRVRKELGEATCPVTEVSIGVQHVSCILPSEYLAMLMGYFSLPDWNAKENGLCHNKDEKFVNFQDSRISISYKVEILDSVVILPMESLTDRFLQLDLPQIYFSFIPSCNLPVVDMYFPLEHTGKTADERVDSINVFGRRVCLSLMLSGIDEKFLFKFDGCNPLRNFPIISELDAGLWIRIPCETNNSGEQSTSIMMKADVCNLNAQAECFSVGLEAAICVIEQLSTVGKESEFFKVDVFQFLQLKKHWKNSNDIIVAIPSESLTYVALSFGSLSLKLSRMNTKCSSSGVVAKADMQLNLSALLRNEKLQTLDVNISALSLHSFESSALLLSFIPDDTVSSHLCINFSGSHGKNELVISGPRFDVWLYFPIWKDVIDLLFSCTSVLNNTSSTSSGSSSPQNQARVDSESAFSSSFPECGIEDKVVLTLKSENVLIYFHLPLSDKEEHHKKSEAPEMVDVIPSFEPTKRKLLKFTLRGKSVELVICTNHLRLKCTIEKLRALLETIHSNDVTLVPFLRISKIGVELCRRPGNLGDFFAKIQAESLDMGLSHKIIKFLGHSQFIFPETSSSPIYCHCVDVDVHLKKSSILLSDGRWSPHGPILELLMQNLLLKFNQTGDIMEGSIMSDLLINYNNIDKVVWEPFVEPWSFQSNIRRKAGGDAILNTSRNSEIYIKSTRQLNLNITEPLVEAFFRVNTIITDALSNKGSDELSESWGANGFQNIDDMHTRRYAPYILRNDTSLPLSFHVSCGPNKRDDVDSFSIRNGKLLQPGVSVPIYVEENQAEHVYQRTTIHSSERLIDKTMSGVAHHMISIQFDGTSGPSQPMSMDLVGLSYFEVNFSNHMSSAAEVERDENTSGYNRKSGESNISDLNNGLVVPVVFEVSIHQYSKMIRIYSTVLLINTTVVPLEIRFDIPFGVSPKILDPILPGQEFPLPLHLAEAGRIRWRPAGTCYLWSETHSLSNILSHGNRLGFLKPFVCYPSHPNSDPFRCCMSVHHISLGPAYKGKDSCLDKSANGWPAVKGSGHRIQNPDLTKTRFIRQVRLTTPFLVKNYLPVDLSLTVDCGGVAHPVSASKEDTASVFYVDSTHELGVTFNMRGFRPTCSKFPRAESFIAMTKFNGSKFQFSEILTFNSDTSDCSICVTIDKAMDSFSGAREICLSVPYLLYNCTGLSLTIIDGNHEKKGCPQVIPSSYYLCGQEQLLAKKHGLAFLCSEMESHPRALEHKNFVYPFSTNRTLSTIKTAYLYDHKRLRRDFASPVSDWHSCDPDGKLPVVKPKDFHHSGGSGSEINSLPLSETLGSGSDLQNMDGKMVEGHMYAPSDQNSSPELMVKLSAALPQCGMEITSNRTWSSSFSLVPASGSASVSIPQPWASGAFLISVTSIPVDGELSRRTRAITFQPRYVICNACKRDLCYKQKGTNYFYGLCAGQHSHLHWSDTARELLVSIRFNEPGWQWSGSFLPDCLGDTQVKMLNYVSGALNMVRAEVRNAGLAINDNIRRSSNGTSMTQLILLSDDETGFMPYRIDNFSMERLRIYQQRCQNFETSVNPYTSCQYAWDEPCYPHRLVVEVPGERILGTFSLDDTREYMPIFLPSTSDKPDRRFHVSITAEGAIKVFSIVDLNCHVGKDVKGTGFFGLKEKREVNQKQQCEDDFNEMITLHLPFVGVSLMNSSPQELVFASVKDATILLFQSLDQQKFLFQIISLQIDNQLPDTPYPIMLTFNNELSGRSSNYLKSKENLVRVQNENVNSACDGALESIFYLTAARWRRPDPSLISFEYVNLWLAPLCIELDEQIVSSLLDFIRTISSRLQSRTIQNDFQLQTLEYSMSSIREFLPTVHDYEQGKYSLLGISKFLETKSNLSLPSVAPVGAPWQHIYLLARRQKKIYIELFELAPIKLSISFSSSPWMVRNETRAETEPFSRVSGASFQRGLMALIDVEGVPVHLRQLTLEHLMASKESIQEILTRHYTRQLLHEIYKVFGSAGVIGNPMGFARNVGVGIKDFLSVSTQGVVQSPSGLFTGIAQGSKSLLSNTVYAMSSATTQFSKAAHKGIVALAFHEHTSNMDGQQKGLDSGNKGLVNEFLEGLTGLLQSPIRGAEKHGLPGVLSGIAMGTAGLVARPMASILEAMGKAAQSIRNRSSPHQSNRLRVRFPRPLSRELPLLPYSWEEAIGVSVLLQADESRLKDEGLIMCKELKQEGKFIIITDRLLLVVWSSQLVGFRSSKFSGVATDPGWVIETEMSLESVVHIDREEETVNIVGSNLLSQQTKGGTKNRPWSPPLSAPLFQICVDMPNEEEAMGVLQLLVSTIEQGREQKRAVHVLHRRNLR
ncbi:hypothetical protein J5N97_025549 [Dioscorea zingiberensis]|uniref:Vacuolar protein sorting-associated protein n=1 Tax=Dioscorea zingiberensis TaxID=325984 RepID=A0A9D5C8G3_9LILI|nr:hypothetical protein J5N97_025549 [Dioscorea zingiberensis]